MRKWNKPAHDERAVLPKHSLGPKIRNLWGFDLGSLISGFECRFDLPRIEEVYAGRCTRDDEHPFGARGSQVLHLIIDVVGDAAEESALIAVGQRNHDRAFRAGDNVGVRPGAGDTTVHAIALAQQRRTNYSGQRGTCGSSVSQRYAVLARGGLADDQSFACVAIVCRRIHLTDWPVGPTVAR